MNQSVLLAALLGSVLAVLGWQRLRPTRWRITPGMISATLPWFGVVGALRGTEKVLDGTAGLQGFRTGILAYVGTALGVVVLWGVTTAVDPRRRVRYTLGGAIVVLAVITGTVGIALTPASITVAWEIAAVVGATMLTALVWHLARSVVDTDSTVAASVVFSHVLDATTTMVGLGVLGAAEQNPVSRSIIEAGDHLGTPGAGLVVFLSVKVAVALALVALVSDDPGPESIRGAAVLTVAAGAGLVPAVHNLVVFAAMSP